MTKNFIKGDIIQGNERNFDEAYHPIIYFGEIDGTFFLGGMITHSQDYGNIVLDDSHFENKIDNNSKPSYFVANYLVKKLDWGPFKKIGKLTEEGVKFIESELDNSKPEIWENYINKNGRK